MVKSQYFNLQGSREDETGRIQSSRELETAVESEIVKAKPDNYVAPRPIVVREPISLYEALFSISLLAAKKR